MIDIFTFIPQITGLGIQLICSAIILAVAAEVIYFVHINPDVGYGIMGIFIFLIIFSLLIGIFVKIGKIYPRFKRLIDVSANISSYASNLITILVLAILFLAIVVTIIPSLLSFFFLEAEPTNNMILNIVILPILAAISFWGLIYYFKKFLALNGFNKWKKFKPTKS